MKHSNNEPVRLPVARAHESLANQDRELRKALGAMVGAAAVIGVGVVAGIGIYHATDPANQGPHDISYLEQYDQATVVVRPGDTPNQIVNDVTGGESNQLRADLIDQIRRQEHPDANGNESLFPGDVITVAIPPQDQK